MVFYSGHQNKASMLGLWKFLFEPCTLFVVGKVLETRRDHDSEWLKLQWRSLSNEKAQEDTLGHSMHEFEKVVLTVAYAWKG